MLLLGVFIVTTFGWDASSLQVHLGEVMHCKGKVSALSKKRI